MNKKLKEFIRRIPVLALIVLAYTFFFQTMYCWMFYGVPFADFTLLELAFSLLLNYIPIFLLAVAAVGICCATETVPKLWKKLLIDSSLVALALVVINLLFKFITGMHINWGGTIFNGVMVLLGIEYWSLMDQKHKALIRENILEHENLTMKYEVLQSYVNPHFLYNSLDMLCGMIEEDSKDESIAFIVSLSAYYRAMTRKMNLTTTTVSEELSMLRNYFDIVRHHYGAGILLDIEGEDRGDIQLIPYSLQLLVENVLKHNIIDPSRPIRILVRITNDGITVSNTYIPKEINGYKSGGLGLTYLKNLYAYRGGKVEISRTPEEFNVHLPRIA